MSWDPAMSAAPTVPDDVSALRERLVADITTLVRVESPSEDHAAVARSARAVADLGEDVLGMPGVVVEVGDVRHVRWRLGSRHRRVLLLGHHDTVWPVGTLDTIPCEVVDGVMRGPGCFDMKAGIVLALHAVETVARRHGPRAVDGVTILVTGDEEVGSDTSRDLVESESRGCDAVLVCEPGLADGSVKVARKGASVYRVVAHGHASHAGLDPEEGVNATVELAAQIPAIVALARPEVGTTVTPTRLTGGTTANTVPDVASVTVDVRAGTPEEQRRVDRGMHELAPMLDGATLEILGGPNRPPLVRGLADPLADLADQVCHDLDMPVPGRASVGGASDGNFTAGAGIPTLDGLGATGSGAHARDEHLLVDGLVTRHQLLVGLLERLLDTTP